MFALYLCCVVAALDANKDIIGILSPLLFNVYNYVDEFIDSLSDSGFGCYIGSQFFGCIMYADDLIMLSPSLKGLQSMFNLCDAYAKTHFLIFNAKKRSLCQ